MKAREEYLDAARIVLARNGFGAYLSGASKPTAQVRDQAIALLTRQGVDQHLATAIVLDLWGV